MSISERPAITFHDVWKSFARHAGQMLIRDRLKHLLPRAKEGHRKLDVLRGVSFVLNRGESVALVGRNGAGKSTLLSIATKLCRPDRGLVETNGRVAALLALGSGFHPDLTGLENIHINSALMGFTRKEVYERLDEIITFAEIGDSIHEPLRTYSTGMVMRLAFSVAITVDPDILIVDEVLGVGDAAFSAKCLKRLARFRNSGKAILCVSHSAATLTDMCDRGLWLEAGSIVTDGPIVEVVQAYSDHTAPSYAVCASR